MFSEASDDHVSNEIDETQECEGVDGQISRFG